VEAVDEETAASTSLITRNTTFYRDKPNMQLIFVLFEHTRACAHKLCKSSNQRSTH